MSLSFILIMLFVFVAGPVIVILILHSGNPFRKEKNTSKSHLKKNETLKVNLKNGRWWCPSCGDSNLPAKDDCGSCGQKVDKNTP
ncbi:MAG: hypothetical protein PHP17_04705 [Candidatus Omnitrophica bacterium]|nr:hypothetical protein [Candidatus Omnitrophota bacterium]